MDFVNYVDNYCLASAIPKKGKVVTHIIHKAPQQQQFFIFFNKNKETTYLSLRGMKKINGTKGLTLPLERLRFVEVL